MKAIVLAAGRGRRLGDMLGNRNKCMIPVNRRPVIEYSFGSVANTEVKEMIVVVGFRAEEIINTYGNNYKGVRIKYVVQQEQKGLVHALECSAAMLDGDDFILLLGDEVLVNPRHQKLISEFRGDSAIALCGVLKVEDRSFIKRTYSILHDEKNKVYRLIEKPRNPLNDLMGTGDCVFRNEILSYIEFTPAHHERKEKELPDLIQCAIDDGKLVRSFTICDRYTNINTPEDVTLAESFFNESGCYI
ncbi:MAG TPA: nucleotidyl transferase [Deltaproteobacteria bacterium]|nr:MAG: nucleotidyl transferase [Deltaproteobacteria bacterium GWA2_55_82]OGQ62617.1 MAG: nucleotidyl transferase [Deltaproteobacteria bacterium RIFCSPLOWO2_02_FULL_55_12]OIJ74207.1 MAG: nucleotidyl transferase [Deltaproteobacteria bacterium GWC2_55_46]HBG46830.1 nucleotidyl transferase [Deltaproteobacteria bacterium]HCY11112.1 nucleotidyl transferase [Deltaproteobacteria bacterium]